MVQQVVIVDQTHQIDKSLLHNAAVALNTQVTRDLTQYWSGITANVSSAPSLAAMSAGAWPVFLVKTLPPDEGGFHLDKHNQPYAKVIASPKDATWTIDASHEIIEMLVDPYGNRMQSSQAIVIAGNNVIDGNGVFHYLVEACDPCEANNFAYDISGIAVSDFITPHFYDASLTATTRYSFTGSIKRPRQVLPGGYISYVQPDHQWNQILWVDPNQAPRSTRCHKLRTALVRCGWRSTVRWAPSSIKRSIFSGARKTDSQRASEATWHHIRSTAPRRDARSTCKVGTSSKTPSRLAPLSDPPRSGASPDRGGHGRRQNRSFERLGRTAWIRAR
jgi:hypothetical protein